MYWSPVHILHKWGPFCCPRVYCQIIACRPILLCIPKKKHPLRDPEWQGALSQLGIEGYVSQFATQYHPQGKQPVCKDSWGLNHGFLCIVSSPRCQACAGVGSVWAYGLHRWPFHTKYMNWMSVGKGKGKTCWTVMSLALPYAYRPPIFAFLTLPIEPDCTTATAIQCDLPRKPRDLAWCDCLCSHAALL